MGCKQTKERLRSDSEQGLLSPNSCTAQRGRGDCTEGLGSNHNSAGDHHRSNNISSGISSSVGSGTTEPFDSLGSATSGNCKGERSSLAADAGRHEPANQFDPVPQRHHPSSSAEEEEEDGNDSDGDSKNNFLSGGAHAMASSCSGLHEQIEENQRTDAAQAAAQYQERVQAKQAAQVEHQKRLNVEEFDPVRPLDSFNVTHRGLLGRCCDRRMPELLPISFVHYVASIVVNGGAGSGGTNAGSARAGATASQQNSKNAGKSNLNGTVTPTDSPDAILPPTRATSTSGTVDDGGHSPILASRHASQLLAATAGGSSSPNGVSINGPQGTAAAWGGGVMTGVPRRSHWFSVCGASHDFMPSCLRELGFVNGSLAASPTGPRSTSRGFPTSGSTPLLPATGVRPANFNSSLRGGAYNSSSTDPASLGTGRSPNTPQAPAQPPGPQLLFPTPEEIAKMSPEERQEKYNYIVARNPRYVGLKDAFAFALSEKVSASPDSRFLRKRNLKPAEGVTFVRWNRVEFFNPNIFTLVRAVAATQGTTDIVPLAYGDGVVANGGSNSGSDGSPTNHTGGSGTYHRSHSSVFGRRQASSSVLHGGENAHLHNLESLVNNYSFGQHIIAEGENQSFSATSVGGSAAGGGGLLQQLSRGGLMSTKKKSKRGKSGSVSDMAALSRGRHHIGTEFPDDSVLCLAMALPASRFPTLRGVPQLPHQNLYNRTFCVDGSSRVMSSMSGGAVAAEEATRRNAKGGLSANQKWNVIPTQTHLIAFSVSSFSASIDPMRDESAFTKLPVDVDVTKGSVRKTYGEGVLTDVMYGGTLVIECSSLAAAQELEKILTEMSWEETKAVGNILSDVQKRFKARRQELGKGKKTLSAASSKSKPDNNSTTTPITTMSSSDGTASDAAQIKTKTATTSPATAEQSDSLDTFQFRILRRVGGRPMRDAVEFSQISFFFGDMGALASYHGTPNSMNPPVGSTTDAFGDPDTSATFSRMASVWVGLQSIAAVIRTWGLHLLANPEYAQPTALYIQKFSGIAPALQCTALGNLGHADARDASDTESALDADLRFFAPELGYALQNSAAAAAAAGGGGGGGESGILGDVFEVNNGGPKGSGIEKSGGGGVGGPSSGMGGTEDSSPLHYPEKRIPKYNRFYSSQPNSVASTPRSAAAFAQGSGGSDGWRKSSISQELSHGGGSGIGGGGQGMGPKCFSLETLPGAPHTSLDPSGSSDSDTFMDSGAAHPPHSKAAGARQESGHESDYSLPPYPRSPQQATVGYVDGDVTLAARSRHDLPRLLTRTASTPSAAAAAAAAAATPAPSHTWSNHTEGSPPHRLRTNSTDFEDNVSDSFLCSRSRQDTFVYPSRMVSECGIGMLEGNQVKKQQQKQKKNGCPTLHGSVPPARVNTARPPSVSVAGTTKPPKPNAKDTPTNGPSIGAGGGVVTLLTTSSLLSSKKVVQKRGGTTVTRKLRQSRNGKARTVAAAAAAVASTPSSPPVAAVSAPHTRDDSPGGSLHTLPQSSTMTLAEAQEVNEEMWNMAVLEVKALQQELSEMQEASAAAEDRHTQLCEDFSTLQKAFLPHTSTRDFDLVSLYLKTAIFEPADLAKGCYYLHSQDWLAFLMAVWTSPTNAIKSVNIAVDLQWKDLPKLGMVAGLVHHHFAGASLEKLEINATKLLGILPPSSSADGGSDGMMGYPLQWGMPGGCDLGPNCPPFYISPEQARDTLWLLLSAMATSASVGSVRVILNGYPYGTESGGGGCGADLAPGGGGGGLSGEAERKRRPFPLLFPKKKNSYRLALKEFQLRLDPFIVSSSSIQFSPSKNDPSTAQSTPTITPSLSATFSLAASGSASYHSAIVSSHNNKKKGVWRPKFMSKITSSASINGAIKRSPQDAESEEVIVHDHHSQQRDWMHEEADVELRPFCNVLCHFCSSMPTSPIDLYDSPVPDDTPMHYHNEYNNNQNHKHYYIPIAQRWRLMEAVEAEAQAARMRRGVSNADETQWKLPKVMITTNRVFGLKSREEERAVMHDEEIRLRRHSDEIWDILQTAVKHYNKGLSGAANGEGDKAFISLER